MGKSGITILGTILTAASVLLPPKGHAACPTNVDFEIVVHFSGISGDTANCPVSVEPVAVVGEDARLCGSDKPDCIGKTNNGGGATKVRWRSVPEGMKFAVYFSPFVGPTIKTVDTDGCADGTIQTGGTDNVPPVVDGTEVTYKYTIASLGTGNEIIAACQPLDPQVIIEH